MHTKEGERGHNYPVIRYLIALPLLVRPRGYLIHRGEVLQLKKKVN
jgi:hypothetical protein